MKKEVNENEDKLHNLLTNLESTEKKEDEFWKEYKNLEKDILQYQVHYQNYFLNYFKLLVLSLAFSYLLL